LANFLWVAAGTAFALPSGMLIRLMCSLILFRGGLIRSVSSDMGICMKTTVEISDALFEEAKAVASRERTTVRALIEDGLRRVLGERRTGRQAFVLRQASFKGRGLQPHVAEGGWERLRELTYEGRGA